jgi:hypothetical protein
MKIDFDDTSYIEFIVSSKGTIQIILSARDGKNSKNNIVNSAEISLEQFSNLVKDVNSKLEK